MRTDLTTVARTARGLAIALLILGSLTFAQALIPAITSPSFYQSLGSLRTCGVIVTGAGYFICLWFSGPIAVVAAWAFSAATADPSAGGAEDDTARGSADA